MDAETTTLNEKSPLVMRRRKPVGLRILLVVLSSVFVVAAVLAVIGYDVWRVAFNPPVVKGILVEEFVESDLVPRVLEDLSLRRARERVEKGESLSGVNEPDIELLLSYVAFERWVEIRDLVVEDAFVEGVISVSVDGLYAWIDSPEPTPDFVWEMAPLKARLVGAEGEWAIMLAYESMPECTQAEIDDFTSRLEAMPPGVEVLYNLCQFPDPWREDQIEDYLNALVDVNQNIPDVYDFGQMLSADGGGNPATLASLKGFLRLTRLIGRWGWVVPLGLLGLIAAVGVRSWGDLGRWVGIPLLIAGVLVAVVAAPVRSGLLNLLVNRFPLAVSDVLRAELRLSLTRLTDAVFQPMLVQGLIGLGAGAALLVLGILLGRRRAPAAVAEEAGSA